MEQSPASTVTEEPAIEPRMIEVALEKFRSEQNLVGGMLAGVAAALAGASVWAVITVATGYQIGWMALGVGLVVGMAVRYVGKGIDRSFAVAGAVLALGGCLLGNLFTVCHFVAESEKMGFFEVLSRLNPAIVFALLKATFTPMDLAFYAIAGYEGYKLSTRHIAQEELMAAIKGTGATHGL